MPSPALNNLLASRSNKEPGLWLDIPFDENGGIVAKNKAAPNYRGSDVLGFPEQVFALANSSNSGVPTDGGRTDPTGGTNASRFNVAAGARWFGINPVSLTGQHTISIWAKSNTGSAQNMRIAPDASGSQWGSNISVATTWTQISRTVTSPSAVLIGNDGSSAIDVDVWGLDVTPGASVGNNPNLGWHVIFSPLRRPVWSASGMVMTSSRKQAIALSSTQPKTLTQFSFYAVVKRSGSQFISGYNPIVNVGQTGTTFNLHAGYNNLSPGGFFGGIGQTADVGTTIEGDGQTHVFAWVCDGSTARCYLDGTVVAIKTGTMTAQSITNMFIGDFAAAGFGGDFYYLKAYDIAHSATKVRQITQDFRTTMRARGVTVATPTNFMAFEGDSITAASGNNMTGTTLSPTTKFCNLSVSASQLVHLTSRAANLDERIQPGMNNILYALFGTNDSTTVTASSYFTSYKAWWQARRAAGWNKLVVATLTPRSATANNTWVKELNDLIKADTSFYDALCDYDGDATIGRDQGGNATYYPDGLHPSAACYAIMKPIADAALTSVLV
jgi:hypothetical protein